MLLGVLVITVSFSASFCIPFPKGSLDTRIVGGGEVNITDFPYQASLERIGIDQCGATIVGLNKALTAGHCIKRHDDYFVRCGTDIVITGGQLIKVQSARIHPDYDSHSYINDIAVLILEKNIVISSTSIPISLSMNFLGGNRECWVSGWGRLSETGKRPKILNAVKVKEFSQEECKDIYRRYKITESMICFGDPHSQRDACQGDSGGPLVDKVNNELVGITSFGLGCATKKPGVYANVAVLYDWIMEQH